jgi:hypothetical protein
MMRDETHLGVREMSSSSLMINDVAIVSKDLYRAAPSTHLSRCCGNHVVKKVVIDQAIESFEDRSNSRPFCL